MPKQYFIVQEKYGSNLAAIYSLNNKNLKQTDILKLGIQLIKNIQKLHEIGYLHTDIKPESLVLEKDQKCFNLEPNINQNILFRSLEQ
jgi:serine/threonine protein kinase